MAPSSQVSSTLDEALTPARPVQVTYAAPMSGEYKVTLAVGTVIVAGSPFRVPLRLNRSLDEPGREARLLLWPTVEATDGDRLRHRSD